MKVVHGVVLFATLLGCIYTGLGNEVGERKIELRVNRVKRDASTGDYRVNIVADNKEHQLHLRKNLAADNTVHDDVKVVFANTNKRGKLLLNEWSPSQEELASANDFYVDPKSKSAVRIQEADGKYTLNGILDGFTIEHDGVDHSGHILKTARNDMLRIPGDKRNITEGSIKNVVADDFPHVVELLIFCDMEFGQLFNFDRQKILDYWTIFMWDVNNRYHTLESVKVSFKTISVIVAESKSAQGYLENARDPNTGLAEHGRILNEWIKWAPQQTNLPNYDMVVLASKTDMEWGGGLAWVGGVCNNGGYNVASWNENGRWSTVSMASHEMGHNMGADHDDDPNGACKEHIYHGYIMDGSDDDRRFFFSICSDRDIARNVLSSDKECLRNLGQSGAPALRENYDYPLAPSLDDQCKQESQDNLATYKSHYGNVCKRALCQDRNGRNFDIRPLGNSPCNPSSPEARCFRGNCREKGHIFKNVGSGLCMVSSSPFTYSSGNKFIKCNEVYASPLDRLVVRSDNGGTTLAYPFEEGGDTKETGDKCMWTGISSEAVIGTSTDRCGDYSNPWHRWDFVDAGNGEFLIKHRETNRCLRPWSNVEGSEVVADNNCQTGDRNMRFTRVL